ncbi:hypothetical protein Esti_001501 [Eimeria stiedai]
MRRPPEIFRSSHFVGALLKRLLATAERRSRASLVSHESFPNLLKLRLPPTPRSITGRTDCLCRLLHRAQQEGLNVMQNLKGPRFRLPSWGQMLRLFFCVSLAAFTLTSCGSVPLDLLAARSHLEASTSSLRLLYLPLLHFCVNIEAAGSTSHPRTEATLLSRIEAKHGLFPTYVYGQSHSGNPVVYKPSLGGLRDFRRLFVLQTDAYIIDLLLQTTPAESFTLVLDLSALSGRMRRPTLDMWDSLRKVVDPLPAQERVSIERLVARIFERCEAVVVVNASSFVKLLKPVIALMFPVKSDRLFVSTDLSALRHVVHDSKVPKPYNPSCAAHVSSNQQTAQLYELLSQRAKQVLGRPLAISSETAVTPSAAATAAPAVNEPGMVSKNKVGYASEKARGGDEDEDDFDDID